MKAWGWMAVAGLVAACGWGSDSTVTRSAAALGLPEEVGAVCGDPAILGVEVGAVPGPGACGIEEAVRLYAVDGVVLDGRALVNCNTARALQTWVVEGAKPALAEAGKELAALDVAAHYACRRRNHQPGAKLSEHAKGNAIDIAALDLTDGARLSVARDWRAAETGPLMRRLHRLACGPFGTVLGPDSDRFHQNHFHFDVASYRSGPFCR